MQNNSSSEKFFAAVGVLFPLFLLGNYASHYGSRWVFGRFGIPRTLVGPDGWTYADGSPLDPITASLIRSGREEEVMLFLCGGLFVLVLMLVRTVQTGAKLRRKHELTRALLEQALRQHPR